MSSVRLLTLLVLIALVLGLGAPDTASAAYCWGSSCNGRNPQGTDCQNGAYRVFGVGYPVGSFGVVEIWYSPACNANWGRAYGYYYAPSRVWLEQNGGIYPASKVPIQCNGYTCWTPMRDGSYLTKAWAIIGPYTGETPWA